MEEGELPLAVGVPADGLTFDAQSLQLEHGGLDVVHPEGQVAQALGFRGAEPGGGVGNGENLQLAVPKAQVQLPVPTVLPEVLPQNGKAQLLHVELLGLLVVRDDDGHMVHLIEQHSFLLSLRGGYAPPVYHDWCIVSSSFKRPAK